MHKFMKLKGEILIYFCVSFFLYKSQNQMLFLTEESTLFEQCVLLLVEKKTSRNIFLNLCWYVIALQWMFLKLKVL